MKRLFNEHLKRNVITLSGAWRFALDPEMRGLENGWQNGLPKYETVITPSVWNNELGLLNYEGLGWYETSFISNGGTVMLEFESVMTKATVWLDGELLGEHYGAFTEFQLIANDLDFGEHKLVACVDNRIDKKSFPQRRTDWFNYGGIARDVFAHELRGISILNNHIVYELSRDLKSADVCSVITLYNASPVPTASNVKITVGESVIYSESLTLQGHEEITLTTPRSTLSDIELWDTASPKLYTVVASTDTDDLIDKTGFRRIEVKDNDILLNGRSIRLCGVNRHEEHPEWGFAFPPKLMKKDIDLILDMNCNTVRGSHYPNSKIFIDMLDERGILFWSEIPMWGIGFSHDALRDEDVINRGLEMHREMTKFYYNHPCIIIWGMHNEIDTAQEFTIPLTKKYYEHLRAFGGNRLITHASNHPLTDVCMDYNDIICLNVYNGWYSGNLKDWDKLMVDFKKRLEDKNWLGKPVIMSEFGAGALAGFHSPFDTVRWSEEYQRDLIEYCIELFNNTDYMRGTYVWQFANIRTSPTMDINRVRYFNNKGIVDEYRNPKLAYFKIKELYKKYSTE